MKEYITNKYYLLHQHSLIFRCISTIVLLMIKNNKNDISNIDEITSHLLVNGQCFINIDKQVIQYDSLQIENNKYYKFNYKNNVTHLSNVKRIFLNHLRISPFELAIKFSNTLNIIHSYINNIVKNGGRPSGVFSINNLGPQSNKDEIRQALSSFLTNLGTNNSSMIIEGGYQWQNLGTTPRELQILDIQKDLSKSICMCFNIPPVLMGIEEKVYTNNYNSARNQFNEDFVIPMYTQIINSIT